MRKPTPRQLRLWAYRRRKRLRQLRKKRTTLGLTTYSDYAGGRSYSFRPKLTARTDRAPIHIELPAVLSLRRNRDATLDVYETIRRAIRKNRRLSMDFTTVREVTPAAALILASEIDRWRTLLAIRPNVIDVDKWDPSILCAFYDMGLFDLVEALNPPTLDPNLQPEETFIRYRTGRAALGGEALALRQTIEGVIGEDLTGRRELFRGITEAMTNVHKHAYLGQESQGTPFIRDTWWIGGGFNIRDRRLRVLIFDQGVGIPATLPRRYARERFMDVIRGRGLADSDGSRIAAAMELGKTRTGNLNQGKGLADLQRFVNAADHGLLRILSRGGEYLYSDFQPSEQIYTHARPLGGTLIQWEVSV